ncbi:hypothetical protein CONLIGDRAFT_463500 [Coniochaeta ligniaria NRRL 30616]|uniref:Zn(2)-C6 fungal-type domain-containing protein n=1 Tax=Coniochaeta ligniaria NRRL 30616 TaxID=1408157 RepID=A0A1J7IL56_9PEZI|nr:hypothetical protein CONLIGDRAFT_463500 [Coniochaeta ligniaria NRRL 30616]
MSSKRKTTESVVASADIEQGREASGEPRGRTAVKRQRVSRACDQCRAAREKCDGIQPLCFPCVSQNRPCTYQANPKKRGVQTGYIRTLELALAWVFEKVDGSEDALSSLLSHEGGQGQRLLTGSESAAANRLHQKWRRSRVHKAIDRILSGEESISLQDDKSPSLDDATDTDGEADKSAGPSLVPDGSSRVLHPTSASGHPYQSTYSAGWRLMHEERGSGKAVASPPDPLLSAIPVPPSGLKLPSNHWRLMDIYFSYTHCWLPILEKQEMFQTSYLYSSEHGLELSPENPSTGAHAELWSALALASYQDVASSRPSMVAQGNISGSMTPNQIYNVARSMVPADDGTFQIHHTRALILLSLVNLGRRNLTLSWLLIGKAVRIFLDISSRDRFDHEKQQQRLRSVFIACFIMDTMVSQQHRKPPHLTVEDMAEAMNISENDLDEWQPWAACEGFGHGGDNSRISRNPAYCLSTFNQLYEIFKVISRKMATRRARAQHPEFTIGQDQLQKAINQQAPFGTYILSVDVESRAHVPPPYLLKICYLWATGLVDTISSSTAQLIMGVIEQYRNRFGTCAMPPFIAACLSSWANQPEFEGLDQQDKVRITALQDSHASIWGTKQGSSPSHIHTRGPQHTSSTYKHVDEVERRPNTLVPSFDSSITYSRPGPSYANPVLPGESLSPSHGRDNLNSPYIFPSYGNPRGLLSPAVTVMTRDTTQDAISDMETTMAAHAAANLRPQYHMPSQPTLSVGSTDYDALLDDLASIDYADRIEADPQFMVNLGFAPGCDLNEVLSVDFARF